MSNLTLFQKSESLIMAQAKKFMELAKSHKAVNFEQEAHFALQALKGNDFLAKTAASNPDSLIAAVHNIASIGLSLNPALKHAYLVPRDGKVCLDIGYKGLVHLALDAGGVRYIQAEMVFEKDTFALKSRGEEPTHIRDPFNPDRGAPRGVYCIAKTIDGEFLVETMPMHEVYAIRDRTQAYKAFKEGKTRSCPWVSDENEMTKKTAIRRASKMWPMTNSGRFEKAIQVQDEVDAVDVTPIATESTPQITEPKKDQFKEIRDLLKALGKEEEKFLSYVSSVNNRKIETIEDLSEKEVEQVLIQLYSWANQAQQKEAADAKSE